MSQSGTQSTEDHDGTTVEVHHNTPHRPAAFWKEVNGAIYELRLQISLNDLDKYVRYYRKNFYPVDLKHPARDLVGIWVREHGDCHNLVFVYRYHSRHKKGYYEAYAQAYAAEHGLTDLLGVGENNEKVWAKIRAAESPLIDMVKSDSAHWYLPLDLDLEDDAEAK
jgi:hypothetical protein